MAAVLVACRIHFAKSRYREKYCICLWCGAMWVLETDPTVVDSLPVALPSLAWASSAIDHSSAPIILSISFTTSSLFASDSWSQLISHPIHLFTAFISHSVLTDCVHSSLHDPTSVLFYIPSTSPTSVHFLLINCNLFRYLLFGFISLYSSSQNTWIFSNYFAVFGPCWSPVLQQDIHVSPPAAGMSIPLDSWPGSNKCHMLLSINGRICHEVTFIIQVAQSILRECFHKAAHY